MEQETPDDAHTPPPAPEQPRLTVVIPAYNEARCIARTLEHIRLYAADRELHWEVIVVDDGSRDDTSDIVRDFIADPLELRLLPNPANRGKGYSVQQGMLAATGDAVLMCDADLSTPIEELEKLQPWLERGFDVVIGSRDLPDSVLNPPQGLPRRWAALVFRMIRRRMLVPELRDTQCGFKLFTHDAARDIFSRQTIPGWLFDCEILALAARLNYRIQEVGVHWHNNPDSRVKPLREALTALPTLLKIRRRLASLGSHADRAPPPT